MARAFEIVPGVPKPIRRDHRNEYDECSAKQNAAVCRAQEFSPKQCQENRTYTKRRTAERNQNLSLCIKNAGSRLAFCLPEAFLLSRF